MSKVFIISTHMLGETCQERVLGFRSENKKMISEDEWTSCFSGFDELLRDYHFYYELPSGGDCRVVAIHELPEGHENRCREWISALRTFFVKDADTDVVFILHDKDLRSEGSLHFYSKENSETRLRVFGFHHGPDDVIFRGICSSYDSSDSFSERMEEVLKVVHVHEIIISCIKGRTFPDDNTISMIQGVEVEPNPCEWRNLYHNPESREYIKLLNKIRRSLLSPYLL